MVHGDLKHMSHGNPWVDREISYGETTPNLKEGQDKCFRFERVDLTTVSINEKCSATISFAEHFQIVRDLPLLLLPLGQHF